MSREKSNMEEWMRTYTVPAIPKDRMEKLIEAGKGYMEGADFDRNSLIDILAGQMKYLPCSFWIAQTLIVIAVSFLICRLGNLRVPLYYPFTVLAVVTPLLLLLSVREISKSAAYDMWEIEQASRCQLVRITACRMVIVGLLDLFFLTVVLFLVSRYFGQPLLKIILCGMVPFNISCACYLRIVAWNEKKDIQYHLIVCMACLSVTFSLVMKQPMVFESAMFGSWIVFYLISVLLLGKSVKRYLEHEKKLGEYIWNLQ